ncbi:AAA family ATPase [Leifsonia sp. RAF41]|uniref:AAA family ATPase n=1 Tax=Leifsonia sp. RAF41 TaxID=3233056 RepID=UPI003F9B9DFF
MTTSTDPASAVRDAFFKAGVETIQVDVKPYPDEVNLVAYVNDLDFARALEASSDIERGIQVDGGPVRFLIVRKADAGNTRSTSAPAKVSGVQDQKVADLVRLLSAKSRVSSAEPSLVYVPDARASLSTIAAGRHHLVFGRRGAGKSALLMEARRGVESEGALVSWTNIQTLRRESPQRVFLYVLNDVLTALISGRKSVSPTSRLSLALSEILEKVEDLLGLAETELRDAERLVPRVQRAIVQYLEVEDVRLFVFVDDFYYVSRDSQPLILDMLHGSIRDSKVWLKIASIRHLTNWWQASPPTGLQSGQDADLIDLDVTLQNPQRASAFLEGILSAYARQVGIPALSRVFSRPALDRLVLASGAVPRDYMVLAVSAIGRAVRRPNAKFAGVQDVNQAAGDAASAKIQELEEDMAANSGVAQRTLETLDLVRRFCLDEQAFTYFLVGYRDKEKNVGPYSLLTDLMDVRLIHLVDAGVSDPNQAGARFEAYMLDLSQFSGSRLKQRISVLDFEDGLFVAKQTRGDVEPVRGTTSRELIGILRKAPVLELGTLV